MDAYYREGWGWWNRPISFPCDPITAVKQSCSCSAIGPSAGHLQVAPEWASPYGATDREPVSTTSARYPCAKIATPPCCSVTNAKPCACWNEQSATK